MSDLPFAPKLGFGVGNQAPDLPFAPKIGFVLWGKEMSDLPFAPKLGFGVGNQTPDLSSGVNSEKVVDFWKNLLIGVLENSQANVPTQNVNRS